MDKATYIRKLTETREQWEATLAGIDEDIMQVPGATGKWSVKDVVSHVAWSAREIAPVMRTHIFTGSELWALPTDERNEIVYQQYRERSLKEVLEDEKQVYAEVLAAARTLSDEDLNDPRRFHGMDETLLPWQIFDGCTARHYQEHLAWLQDGLKQLEREARK